MAKFGKRTTAARAAFEGKVNLSVEDAVSLVKGSAVSKFDETVEIAMNLGVDPRHADQMVRELLIYRMELVRIFVSQFLHVVQRLKRRKLLVQIS